MAWIIAYDDVKAHQFRERGALWTRFLTSSRDSPGLPAAFLLECEPNRVTKPHFHVRDEFLLIVDGNGTLGRHAVAPYSVFFAGANTPYGPIVGDSKTGLTFLVLFSGFDPGAKYLPQSLEMLKQISNRQPWHIMRHAEFLPAEQCASTGDVRLREISGIKDDQGLCAYTLVMAPDSRATAPDPMHGNGQYLVVVEGSLCNDGKEHRAMTIVFVAPEDGSFGVHAGPRGLSAIIMNFPRVQPRGVEQPAPSASPGTKRWQCELCAFAYDEALGLPDDGIAAGTRWEDVPESWTCPDCSASKSDFRMVVVPQESSD